MPDAYIVGSKVLGVALGLTETNRSKPSTGESTFDLGRRCSKIGTAWIHGSNLVMSMERENTPGWL